MKERLVRRLKKFHPIKVKNAMFGMGYYWRRPPPLNVEKMTMGLPRVVLVQLVNYLEGAKHDKLKDACMAALAMLFIILFIILFPNMEDV